MVLDLVSLLLLFLAVLGVMVFNFILLMAHAGYLQADKTFCMCVCSSSNWSLLEQISLAPCSSELMTLYLLDMAWWLSHCKYWLVWVGFLYTVVDRLPSLFGVTRVSKKAWLHQLWWFQLWILYSHHLSWCGWKTHLYIVLPKWQKCHLQISSTDLGDMVLSPGLLFQISP